MQAIILFAADSKIRYLFIPKRIFLKTTIKNSVLLFFFIFFIEYNFAQNLVLNPGFELYSTCPTTISQLSNAIDWDSPNFSTPDYMNICATAVVGIPQNIFGYQFPHSGNAYAGVVTYGGGGGVGTYREYLSGKLSAPLVAGSCYHFEMYISSASTMEFITDEIGVYFSDAVLSSPNYSLFPYVPVVSNQQGVFPDTTGWTLVSGDFTANGGELYLTIGNFKDDNNSAVMQGNPGGFSGQAYLLVDDVSVTACGPGCSVDSTINIHICPSALPYTWNGITYTTSGSYSNTFVTTAGCDSIVTLNLTVLQTGTGITNATVCSSQLPYSWNGNNYTASGSYDITLTAASGCDSISTLNLTINQTPGVSLGNDTIMCMGKTLALKVAAPNASYLWQDGSVNAGCNITSDGIYWVNLSANGCSNADTIKVDFENCDCIPSVPNIFTPNGDGINDQWIIAHHYCRIPLTVSVYNRYGSLVYHSDNYQNDWIGTYGSKNCPDGTYYYVLSLVYPGQKKEIYKGNITIMR